MSIHEYARREAVSDPIGYAVIGPTPRHDGTGYVQFYSPDRVDAEELAAQHPGWTVIPEREYVIRMYARGARRLKVRVQAYGLRSAVRIAEELNPGFTATVVEA